MLGGEAQGRDPRVGAIVQGRYRIIERLGAGGMGMVYLGEHLMIRRKVAIKTLHAQFAGDRDIVGRFHREALAATSIGNQHIVEVLDMGHFDDDGSLYMVLEFLEGKDFGGHIEDGGPQPVGRVVRILLQMCEALSAVHAQGIVHRDLKPENVFLIKRGDNPDFVKVLDFGISKFKAGLDEGGGKMTATGAALGTPYYMAPEQTQGLPNIDHRADIYALGAVMYYALTGRHPLEATNLPMLFVKICTEEPTRLCELRPDIPLELEAVVHRALSKRPEDRQSDCAELRAALLPFAHLDAAPAPVSALQRASSGDVLAPTQLGASAAPAITARGQSGDNAANRSLVGASHTVMQNKPRRTGVVVAASAAAAVLLLGAGALVLRVQGDGPEGEGSASPLSAASPASVASEPTSGTAPAPVVAPSAPRLYAAVPSVHVNITTEPKQAELYLDGNRIANPFDAELPQTKEPRIVEARLSSFESLKQELVLLYPQTVRLTLSKPGVKNAPRATVTREGAEGAQAKPTSAAPAVKPSTKPVAAAPAPAAPVAAPAAPRPTPAAAPRTSTERGLKSPF